ncbi:Isopenicillin N epimerase [BD1-7 clade bacterium]|uniref:Isopenicillin N epimerase n=1 Tax=BD1-7 clade bacterium TaxID=2029982 RepID=A0A5S9QJ90_9GAMM|nr:Isopenicillin N epimerase [BD1-7 clade bacterium]CAA0117846.1 Isopenicillin N epimerase [BD1-7 clade bacterium]
MPPLLNRRDFLLTAGTSAALLPMHHIFADTLAEELTAPTTRPDWERLKQAFILDQDTTYMNVGTTGSMPKHVLAAFGHDNRLIARNPRDRLGNTSGRLEYARGRLASSFGCGADEIVISGNTTYGLTLTLNGLTLEAGDVILTTDQEHPGLLAPLQLLADRKAIEVIKVPLPAGENQTPDDYTERFRQAILAYGERVKLIAFSAPTFTTGTMLPIRSLVDLLVDTYNEYGWPIHSLVDGAHATGMFDLDLNALGIDFFCGAGHKWQCGPGGTGIWYLRNQVSDNNPIPLPRFYPTVSDYYREDRTPPAPNGERGEYDIGNFLQPHGNPNYPAAMALTNVCDFWRQIGRDNIERYAVHGLGLQMKQRITEYWGDESLYSPSKHSTLLSALTTFTPFTRNRDDKDISDLFVSKLYDDYGYIVRNTATPITHRGVTETEYPIRISTHLFHDAKDVQGVFDAMKDLSERFEHGVVAETPTLVSHESDG